MTTNTKNVPVSETMTLRELAGAVGVAMGSAYAWSSKGKLPAGTYRDETGKLRIPLTSAEPFIEERRSDKRRFYGYGIEPFPDDVETVDLAWIAAQLNVTQRRVWVLSSEGALPDSARRIGNSIQIPIDDARQFVEERRTTRRRPFPRHRHPDRSSVGLGWIADEIGVPRRSLYYIINVVPLSDSAYYVGNEFRVPRQDALSWVRAFCDGLGEDTPTARRTRRVWERALGTRASSAQ